MFERGGQPICRRHVYIASFCRWRIPSARLRFTVQDLEAMLARVQMAGGTIGAGIESMPWGERLFYARPAGKRPLFCGRAHTFRGKRRREMKADRKASSSIDEYIAGFTPEIQAVLQKVRATIGRSAPGAEEVISYQMPAFRQNGILVYFAAWKKHIGLYPPISGDAKLQKAVAPYAGPKGNLQFPLDKSIPYDLIARIVKHRVKQDAEKRKKRK
jgi:uncharacterized protein YdhG (YjbR/CyaY superfamily)